MNRVTKCGGFHEPNLCNESDITHSATLFGNETLKWKVVYLPRTSFRINPSGWRYRILYRIHVLVGSSYKTRTNLDHLTRQQHARKDSQNTTARKNKSTHTTVQSSPPLYHTSVRTSEGSEPVISTQNRHCLSICRSRIIKCI